MRGRARYGLVMAGICTALVSFADTNTVESIIAIEGELSNLVRGVVAERLLISTATPDTNITYKIQLVEGLADKTGSVDAAPELLIELQEKLAAVIETLKERRNYKYLLWAEGRLEAVAQRMEKPLNDQQRVQLYLSLGEINGALISENMVHREIMSKMSELYDGMKAENKVVVRRQSIHQQADPFSAVGRMRPRRTLDEF